MRLEDAKRVLADRTAAVAGVEPSDERRILSTTCEGIDPVRRLFSGVDLGEDSEAVIDGMDAVAQNTMGLLLRSRDPGSLYVTLRFAMAQTFITGFLMGEGE